MGSILVVVVEISPSDAIESKSSLFHFVVFYKVKTFLVTGEGLDVDLG